MTDRNADPQTPDEPNSEHAPRPLDRRPDDNRFGYGSDGYSPGEGNDPSATDSGDAGTQDAAQDSPLDNAEDGDPQGG